MDKQVNIASPRKAAEWLADKLGYRAVELEEIPGVPNAKETTIFAVKNRSGDKTHTHIYVEISSDVPPVQTTDLARSNPVRAEDNQEFPEW